MSVPLTEAEILEILSQNTELRRQLQERVLQLSEQTRTNETILETIRGHMNVQESKLKAAERLVDTLKKIVERVEWRNYAPNGQHCPWCGWAKTIGHDEGCEIARVLTPEVKRVEPVKYCMCQPPSTATIKKHREDCHLYGA